MVESERADPASVQSYRDLKVWQEGMALAEQCYVLTRTFPRDELFGLTGQIRRAAASIPANIAEGYGRDSTGEFIRFLQIAQGSLKELETHLLLAVRVGILAESKAEPALAHSDALGRMLRSYYRRLQSRVARPKDIPR